MKRVEGFVCQGDLARPAIQKASALPAAYISSAAFFFFFWGGGGGVVVQKTRKVWKVGSSDMVNPMREGHSMSTTPIYYDKP